MNKKYKLNFEVYFQPDSSDIWTFSWAVFYAKDGHHSMLAVSKNVLTQNQISMLF